MNDAEIVAELSSHFDDVTIHPVAPNELLAKAKATFPSVPDDLISFWQQCDGISVGLHDGVVGNVFGIKTSIEHYEVWLKDDPATDGFIPLRGDTCGNYDCVIARHEFLPRCVAFWDHEERDTPSHLLASSFPQYLKFWCEHLIRCYTSDGQLKPPYKPKKLESYPWYDQEITDPWPYDEDWLRDNDRGADVLLSQVSLRKHFAGQDNLRRVPLPSWQCRPET